jgi:superfamily II DNA/RNA helicase
MSPATSLATDPPHVDDVSTFDELTVPQVLVDVLHDQGIVEPFPIQAATLIDSLAGRDVLGQGRTGSGKTLAFALPVVAHVAGRGPRSRPGHPRALILAPTRELAQQICEVVIPLAEAAGLRVTSVFGGVASQPQLKAFKAGVDILVACPGRLLDHLGTHAVHLDDVQICVLDEADHMADQGFLPMVRRILDATPTDCQRLLFSATLAGGVDLIVKEYLDDPVLHRAQDEAPPLLEHEVLVANEADRLSSLVSSIGSSRAIVFTRTKHRARQYAKKLSAHGVRAVDLHGNLSQAVRQRHLDAFVSGRAQVLVATDIAARGIHIDNVPLVIHADPPVEHKAYTHRSGRTARAGSSGRVLTIASPEQATALRSILSRAGITANWIGIPQGDRRDRRRSGGATAEQPRQRSGQGRPRQGPSRPARRGRRSRHT